MAVPKTTQTRYMDGSVQRTTQLTPSLHLFFIFVFCTKMFPIISQQSLDTRSIPKKRCRNGVTCVVLCTLPSIYLVCVVFGTAIPTSFYILENVFHTCLHAFFFCTIVPYRRLSFSKLSTNTFLRAQKNTAGLRG